MQHHLHSTKPKQYTQYLYQVQAILMKQQYDFRIHLLTMMIMILT